MPAARRRATIAMLALYAVLLQAFLGGLMPISAAADGLCVQQAASDSAPDRLPPHGHGDCCTAAQAMGAALPPRTALAIVARKPEGDDGPAYRSVSQVAPRAPPDLGASSRGPPSA